VPQSSANGPIVVLLAGLAGLAGLVAARIWRRRIHHRLICDAIAAGVLVGLLVGIVARLTGIASVVLARSVPGLQPAELRSLAASIGPLVIQNLTAALVIGVYIVSLRSQRGRVESQAAEQRMAPLFALALGVYALADGMAVAASGLPLTTPLSLNLLAGLALGHICRGLALGGGFATRGDGFGWLGAAALLGGLLGGLGGSMARQLGFEQATVIGVPVLACAVGLLVRLIAAILGPGLGNNLRRLPVPAFVAGLALTLVAARLPGSSPV
jgi:hypothetical protein